MSFFLFPFKSLGPVCGRCELGRWHVPETLPGIWPFQSSAAPYRRVAALFGPRMVLQSFYIVTGASRGIGRALCDVLLKDPSNKVVGVGRSAPAITHPNYTHVCADLADTAGLCSGEITEKIFGSLPSAFAKAALINNAGLLDTAYVGSFDAPTFAQLMTVNSIAPALLCDAFVSKLKDAEGTKIVVNVSSGAAAKNYDGWAAYCSSKAALDRFSEVMQKEQELRQTGIRVYSVYPGIVDTDMQTHIRSGTVDNFSTLQRFKDMHASGDLWSPERSAGRILRIVDAPEQFPDVVIDVRSMAE